MLSSGNTCYHLGWNVIIWDAMLSSGANVIIWDKMLSSEANLIMVSSGANVIIWCYHVMLSSGMITPPFFVFPGNFTHSHNMRDDKAFTVYPSTGLHTLAKPKLNPVRAKTLSCPASAGRTRPVITKTGHNEHRGWQRWEWAAIQMNSQVARGVQENRGRGINSTGTLVYSLFSDKKKK